MKRLILALMLVSVPTLYSAQNLSSGKTKEAYVKKDVQEEQTVEVFVEIEAEEYYKKNILEVNVNMGENYKSLLYDKKDLKLLRQIESEAKEMKNIPDLLNYFSNHGFKIVHYSMLMLDETILNKVILSRRFKKK